MKEKINATVLSILKKNDASSRIEIDYIDIVDSLSVIIQKIGQLCDSTSTPINTIINFIETTSELNLLNGHYSYCESLSAPYQGFNVNNLEFSSEIKKRFDLILFNKKENPDTYDDVKYITQIKQDIKKRYLLWSHALSIEKAYNLCKSNKKIIIYSHRSCGWPIQSIALHQISQSK